MTKQSDLECHNLARSFGDVTAVDGVNFDVPAGSFFSILGPSGCGKTTIMRMIAGFLEPTSGDIRIKGRSVLGVAPNKRPVNMVFQHLALFPMMNVADNIGYGLRRAGVDRTEIARKVDEALERISLPGIGTRKIDELSGGQKQRVAIARCMVLEPDVLLLDEPLGALDLKLREQMKIELKSLQAAFDTTFVYITHDQSEALVMSDQIAVMNNGRFDQIGTGQDLYYRPETRFVAGFVGDSNRWTGQVSRIQGNEVEISMDGGRVLHALNQGHRQNMVVGSAVDAFLRPEAIRIARQEAQLGTVDTRLTGTVEAVLFNGAASRVVLRGADGMTFEVALPQSGEFTNLAKGDNLFVGWQADQALAFTAEQG
jgi:spermidine/putrescine transport system ATP-binding protein